MRAEATGQADLTQGVKIHNWIKDHEITQKLAESWTNTFSLFREPNPHFLQKSKQAKDWFGRS